MKAEILTLPGDGIGPETVNAAVRVLERIAEKYNHDFRFSEALIGGCAIDATGHPLPEDTVRATLAADAVLLGAVGGDKWDNAPVRPEAALLGIRKQLGLYANLRPAKLFPALSEASALKPEIVEKGIDIVTVRELTGGIYFGERGTPNVTPKSKSNACRALHSNLPKRAAKKSVWSTKPTCSLRPNCGAKWCPTSTRTTRPCAWI